MLDLENSERIAEAIAKFDADIVVFDPLRDFGADDLNADRYMTETLREISRITKRGNPKRIPLIIHHAGTGRAGIQKATGFDRSSFGRNSKVLFSWARAQINVVPRLPDDNSLIVISSGKCSNAPEFEPFAAALDEETMLYHRDEDFDFEAWLQSLEPAKRGALTKPTLEMLLDLLPLNASLSKAVVLERLGDKGERINAASDLTVSATPRPPTFSLILRAITSSCASEPIVRGFPCGKKVRWLGWSRLTDLAHCQSITTQASVERSLSPSLFTFAERNGAFDIVG